MYLHVGNNKNIRTRDIIGIFDTDSATVSALTRKYLTAGSEIPKSFVLYRVKDPVSRKASTRICFSQLAAASLKNRTEDKLGV